MAKSIILLMGLLGSLAFAEGSIPDLGAMYGSYFFEDNGPIGGNGPLAGQQVLISKPNFISIPGLGNGEIRTGGRDGAHFVIRFINPDKEKWGSNEHIFCDVNLTGPLSEGEVALNVRGGSGACPPTSLLVKKTTASKFGQASAPVAQATKPDPGWERDDESRRPPVQNRRNPYGSAPIFAPAPSRVAPESSNDE